MTTAASQLRSNGSLPVRRILDSSPHGGVDREATLHRRRKDSMVSLLSEFEREIERHVRPGHQKEIDHFKQSCRRKLNGLTWLACELMKLEPGESLNEYVTDLAEQLEFDASGGQAKP
jgi:hypothetical protein